jgi:hypothetical protein
MHIIVVNMPLVSGYSLHRRVVVRVRARCISTSDLTRQQGVRISLGGPTFSPRETAD